MFGALLERELGGNAVIIGQSGDYVGTLTTEPEYDTQHYEGAMTVYGRVTYERLSQAIVNLGPAEPLSAMHDFADVVLVHTSEDESKIIVPGAGESVTLKNIETGAVTQPDDLLWLDDGVVVASFPTAVDDVAKFVVDGRQIKAAE